MNNPLSATDPTGYFSLRNLFKSIIQIGFAIALNPAAWYVQAAMMGMASYALSGGDLRAGLVAAATAGMFHAVGTAFGPAPQNYLLSGYHMGKILSHGIVGGISEKLGGGNFADGFRSAAVTQAFAPGIDRIGQGSGSVAARASRIAVAAIVGGTASAAGGGKFANGAVTGAFSRAFNHESHTSDGEAETPKFTKDQAADTIEFFYPDDNFRPSPLDINPDAQYLAEQLITAASGVGNTTEILYLITSPATPPSFMTVVGRVLHGAVDRLFTPPTLMERLADEYGMAARVGAAGPNKAAYEEIFRDQLEAARRPR